MNNRLLVFSMLSSLALAGCGSDSANPPADPTLETDIQTTLYPANGTAVYSTTPPTVKVAKGTTAFGTIQLQNIGSQTLNITAVTLTPQGGTPAGVIFLNPQVVPSLPKALAYNAIWPVEVQCTSSNTGTFTATLSVASNDKSSPFTVAVECTFY